VPTLSANRCGCVQKNFDLGRAETSIIISRQRANWGTCASGNTTDAICKDMSNRANEMVAWGGGGVGGHFIAAVHDDTGDRREKFCKKRGWASSPACVGHCTLLLYEDCSDVWMICDGNS
jgi:hypothetical protein